MTKPFEWDDFAGSKRGLDWSRRDLANLEIAVSHTCGRRLALQAGGNLGIFAKRLAQEFDQVYTFEPDGDNFKALCQNAPERNIWKFQAALGDLCGQVAFSRTRRDGKQVTHEGTFHVPMLELNPGELVPAPGITPMLRIDDLGLTRLDLLYLDIEGLELPALRGAVETIARCRPTIAVEINKQTTLAGFAPTAVSELIIRHNYYFAAAPGSDRVFVPLERR